MEAGRPFIPFLFFLLQFVLFLSQENRLWVASIWAMPFGIFVSQRLFHLLYFLPMRVRIAGQLPRQTSRPDISLFDKAFTNADEGRVQPLQFEF